MRTKIDRELLRKIVPGNKVIDIADTELKGFIVRVSPGGAIAYGIRYSDNNGKQFRYSLKKSFPSTSVSDAREEARILLGKIASGENPAEKKKAKTSGKLTLFSFIDGDFGDYIRAHNKAAEATISILKTSFLMYATMALTEIDGKLIDKWRAARVKSGTKPATVNRNIAALSSLFTRALEWKLIQIHPLSSIKKMKETGNPIVRFLSDDEEKRLRAALDNRENRDREGRASANEWREKRKYNLLPALPDNQFIDHLKPAILVSLNTGVRQGELLSLLWSDIDLKKSLMTVRAETSKGAKTRHIPLNTEAKTTLETWSNDGLKSGFVFPGRGGKRMTEVKTAWRKLLNDAGIQGFRWHDMRHHFASRLVMAGVDLNTVRELLGHSDLKMTLRYAHLAPEHTAIAVEKLIKKL